MNKNRGNRRKVRQGVPAGLPIVLLALLAIGCNGARKPEASESAAANATSSAAATRSLPVAPVAPVGRAELLAAAAAAADAVAGGRPLPRANLDLTNRSFELRLPFGCGAGAQSDWGEWSIDPTGRVLRIRVRPQAWSNDETFRALAGDIAYDAAEGFWIERPWTSSEDCPAPVAPVPAVPAADLAADATAGQAFARTFAIVQYFSPDAPRALRRGSRAYAYTGKVPATQAGGRQSFRVKLTGRIRGFSDGQPIHCIVTDVSRPPTCAAALEFNQVSLEDATTGESLAEWNS